MAVVKHMSDPLLAATGPDQQERAMALSMSIEDDSDYRRGMGKKRGAFSIFLNYIILEAYDIQI